MNTLPSVKQVKRAAGYELRHAALVLLVGMAIFIGFQILETVL